MSSCDVVSPDQVQEAFLAATPLIAQEILDLTVTHPSWLRDLYDVEVWPTGAGTQIEQIVFRGAMPQIERGFEKWKKIEGNSGCSPVDSDDCKYNWSAFGGHGLERKITEMMSRDFRSPEYCISKIQTTAHFKEVFSKIVQNLYAQVDFFKEFNLGHNFLTSLAKKYVVDSTGARANPNNPYVYRNIGTKTISALNITMLEFFYEQMRRMPDAVPYDVINGSPVYSLLASSQLLARLYRDDAQARQDVRFSGLANDLLTKYNFMSTIRGMFIAAPILYPRRFTIVAGEPMEVLPFVNGVESEAGAHTNLNPAYELATHEEVLIHGKHPFKVFHQPTETALTDGATFGPSESLMNSWLWINPMTDKDPFRRVGYFATSARLGLSQQFSESIIGILVERPSVGLMFMQNPVGACPVAAPVCDNAVPTVSCPCPQVLAMVKNPVVTATNNWQITFATPVTGAIGSNVQLAMDNGGYVTGVLAAVAGNVAEITLPNTYTGSDNARITGVYCDVTLGCSATVLSGKDCRSGITNRVELTLSNPIKAIAVDAIVLACFGDGTTANLKVVAVDQATLTWSMSYATGFGPTDDPTGAVAPTLNAQMLCDRGGVVKLCVPPTTDASCPACSSVQAACVGPLV